MMKIGIFSDVAEEPNAGPGNHLNNLIKAVTAADTGHEFILLHTSAGDHKLYEGRDSLQISSNPLRNVRTLRTENFDILHLDCIAPFLGDTALVATQFGDVHFAPQHLWPQDRLTNYRKIVAQRILSPFFESVMVSSKSAKSNLVDGGIASDLLHVVNPGLDPAFREVEPDEGGDFLLHVSSCSIRKNPENMLKAYEMLADDHDIPLKIVGQGWSEDLIDRYISSSAVRNRIEWLGRVEKERLISLYQNALLYLAPTRHEGFGLTPLEAMACGTPVVSHHVYAVPEVVGDAALLVDNPEDAAAFADAIGRLLDDEGLRSELREKGLERVDLFSWEDTAEKVIDIYDSVDSRH
ncbi:MAG: glycosyltransferase family 4 protein [Candidatus Nanohaloarchaea archaeon]